MVNYRSVLEEFQVRRMNRQYETSPNPKPNASSQGIEQYNYHFDNDIEAARRFERQIRMSLIKRWDCKSNDNVKSS